jgi:hypothetical protein
MSGGLGQQSTSVQYLQQGQTAAANGTQISTDGFNGALQMEVVESGGGTCTLTIEGSFDGLNWYAVGYQQIDATASLARAVTGISVTANSKHVYQLLDPYPQTRARTSSPAGGVNVTARVYMVPA